MQTHRCGAYRKFFTVIPSYLEIKILAMRYQTATSGTNGLINYIILKWSCFLDISVSNE